MSGTWAAQQGDFTYSYPITLPPALGGQTPDVTLGYDSQFIDGETSGWATCPPMAVRAPPATPPGACRSTTPASGDPCYR
ncbi:MAG TPA: hypothetical protein VHY58_06480 [Streptosporangiaceae bacterium]|nr:hypothetical protein [Streptosporangiaceae bacterium]